MQASYWFPKLKAAPLGIVWHAKDFLKTPEVDADAGETQLESM